MNFSIPKFNRNSFRKNNSLDSSIVFDMGCYPFSLISYFGFSKKIYKIKYTTKNKKINFIEILFKSKKIKFIITLAIYVAYKNYVKIIYKNNSYYQLNHFFYGKKIKKDNYLFLFNKKKKEFKINEENLFKNIFNYSSQKLLKLSKAQYFVIKNYLINLNQIKKYIKL